MASKYKNNSLAIIIPMYNEEEVASKCVDKVLQAIERYSNILLIVVNDGSSDATPTILKNKKIQYGKRLIVLNNKRNLGYGGALQKGIQDAIKKNYEYYLTMDSDLTNPPKYILDFVKIMPKGYDCVKASRYTKGGGVINVPYFRRIISILGNSLASVCFNVGIKDCTNGFKMVRLSFLKGIHFKERNFSIILEEMYYLKKKNAKFYEIPNVLSARKNSRSHFKYRPKIFYDYFKYLVKSVFV